MKENESKRAMRFLCLVGVSLLLSFPTMAQTTGVPGINDYTVAGVGSGGTSCVPVSLTPGSITLSVSGPPIADMPVFFIINTHATGCVPGAFVLPPSPCDIPFTAGGGTSNQSADLLFAAGGPFFFVIASTDASGVASITSPALLAGFSFSTQAMIFDPACAAPGGPPFVMTQAFVATITS